MVAKVINYLRENDGTKNIIDVRAFEPNITFW